MSDAPRLSRRPTGSSISGEAARQSLRAIARSWPALLVISVLTVLVGALADLSAAALVKLTFHPEFAWLHSVVPSRTYSILGLEAALIRTVLDGAAFALGFGATAIVCADALARERVSAFRSLSHSGRSLLALTGAYLGFGVVAVLLALISTPLLVLAPIGIPTAIAGAFLYFQLPSQRRLATWLIVLGLPYGLLIRWAVLLSVALPAVAVGGVGPVSSLRISRRLVAGRWWQAALTAAGASVVVIAATLLFGVLIGGAYSLAVPIASGPEPGWVSGAFLTTSVLVSQVPAVVLTALYLVLRLRPQGPAEDTIHVPRGLAFGFSTVLFMRRLAIAAIATLAVNVLPPLATTAQAAGVNCASMPRYHPPPLPHHSAAPLNLVVSNLNDSGAGSLRDAVTQANNAGGPSTITFGVSGWLQLLSIIQVTAPVTIDGTGQSVSIAGTIQGGSGGNTPLLQTGPGTNPVTIRGLTFTQGQANPCTQAPYAGAVTANAPTTFINDTFSHDIGGEAGAIYATSPVTVTDSTFDSNQGIGVGYPGNPAGGAITAGAAVTATNDTFILNTGSTANVSPSGPPGGTVYITPGASFTANGITLIRSTGGGIVWTNGGLTLNNSLLQGNNNGDCFGFGNPPGAGNADSDGSCGGTHIAASGVSQNLGSNGGTTQTLAIGPGSPAVDNGSSAACPSNDQRGVARPSGHCDSGAYQFQPDVSVTLSSDQPSTGYNLGDTANLTAVVTPLHEPSTASGDVAFWDGTTQLGTATLSQDPTNPAAGDATLSFTTSSTQLPIGTHNGVYAEYLGQARGYADTKSSTISITVNGKLTSLTLASSQNPVTIPGAVSFTANLTALPPGTEAPGTATGDISFWDGDNVTGTQLDDEIVNPNGQGVAPIDTVTTPPITLGWGHHTITAYYSGDPTHGASSVSLDQNVQDVSTISGPATLGPFVFGTATVTATVTSPSGTPGGFVGCLWQPAGGFGQGVSGLLSNGSGTCDGSGWLPGTGTVTLSYGGDDGHVASAPVTISNVTVSPAQVSQALVVDNANHVYGVPVTLTDTISASGTTSVPTGTVDFVLGLTPVVTGVPVSGGVASAIINLPPAGSDHFHAVFHPDPGFQAGSPGSVTVTVTPAATATTLTTDLHNSVTGQPVTLTATVSADAPSSATPTGSVLFTDGAGFSRSVALTNGQAVLVTGALPVGAHTITASYTNDASFVTSTSGGVSVTVAAAGTSTVLAASPGGSSVYSQPVTLTATVSVNAPGTGTPGGSVEFFDGATDLGPGTLDGSGQASLLISLPAPGAHSWSATYAGTPSLTGSSAQPVAYTVYAAGTQLSASSSGTLLYGQPVTITVHVCFPTQTPGVCPDTLNGLAASGPVTFLALGSSHPAGVTLPSATLDSTGTASITSSTIPGDTTQVLVTFPGDGRYQASGTDLSLPMQPATPTVVYSVSPSSPTYFGQVTLTVQLQGIGPGDFPVGFVTPVLDSTNTLPQVPLVNGVGTEVITAPSVGTHFLQATYAGYGNYGPVTLATSGFRRFTVSGADPQLSLSSSPNPAGIGVPFTLTATVLADPTSGVIPAGTVNFMNQGNILLGTAPITPHFDGTGTATLTTTYPAAATLSLTAAFGDTDGFFTNQNAGLSLVVTHLPTTTIAGVYSPPPYLAGKPITLEAFISSTATVTGGTVAFYDGTTLLGVALETNGIALLTCPSNNGCFTALSAGNHPIKAVFTGSAGFAGSTSAVADVSVSAHPSQVTLTANPTSPSVGQTTLITAITSAADGYTATPNGTTTVSDGQGQSCTLGGAGGSCLMSWPAAGPETITATFGGDAIYAPATASLDLTVTRFVPHLVATAPQGAKWIAGEKLTVSWSFPFDSPAPTGTVNVSNAITTACVNQPVTGSCAVTIPGTGAQTITFSYSGDSLYAPATQTLTGTGLACHNFYAQASPSTYGSIAEIPSPDCLNGFGYADGDQVLVIATANPHYAFSGFDGYPAGQQVLNLTVTEDMSIIGRFTYLCDTVTVEYRTGVQWFNDKNTDCGAISQNPVNQEVYLPYRDGETFTLTGEDWQSPTLGPIGFKGWYVDHSTAPEQLGYKGTFVATPGLVISPDVTRPCYTLTVRVNDPNAGTVSQYASLYTGTCYLPGGATGYYWGTQVWLHVTPKVTWFTPNGANYSVLDNPSYRLSSVALSGVDQAAGLTTTASPGYYNFVIHGDNTETVSLDQCHQVSVGMDPQGGQAYFPGSGSTPPSFKTVGRVSVSGTQCVDGYPGWYAGPVTVSASAPDPGYQFYTWHGDTSSGLTPALSPTGGPATITLDGKASHNLTAEFGPNNSCFPAPVEVGGFDTPTATLFPEFAGQLPSSSYGTIQVYATNPDRSTGHGYCPAAYYESGATIMVDVSGSQGIFTGFMGRRLVYNADGTLNSWSNQLTGPLDYDQTPLAGNNVGRPVGQIFMTEPPAGGGAIVGVQAWFCYPVNLNQIAYTSAGTPFDPPLGMIDYTASSSHFCPVAPDTFLPGSTVAVAANARPGYTFQHWQGSIAWNDLALSLPVTGPLNLQAAFLGACYTLSQDDVMSASGTNTGDAIRSDSPNCPGQADKYLAGTVVALQAVDKGTDEPFDGWAGADHANGQLAVVTMTSDKSLHALYNDDLLHPTASASAFGTYMSAVAKGTVGMIATALSDYVLNFTSAGLITLVGSIGTGLGDLGVPGAAAVGQIMNGLAATLNGPLSCVGQWGLSPSSSTNSYIQVGQGVQSGANSANTAVTTLQGQGLIGKLGQQFETIQNFSANNAGALDTASQTTYALKWVALGVQLGMQFSTAQINGDWSMSNFESSMQSCLQGNANQLSNGTEGLASTL